MFYDEKQAGQALQQVPISDMLKGYAESITDAQWALDQKSILMAASLVNTKVRMPDGSGNLRDISLLELGFLPSFYQFKEVTIDISVSLTMKVEQSLKVGLNLSLNVGLGDVASLVKAPGAAAGGTTSAAGGTTPTSGKP